MNELPWEVEEYLIEVETEKYPVCEEQKQMCRLFRRIWEEEELYFDVEQLRKYISYERHFPYKLFPWEKFCFAIHNTLYKSPGVLRFPVLFICVGRGAGKTGFSAFENFCLLTETNGVKEYDIYTFAMSEKQAKMAWEDMYNILEGNPTKYRKFFHWTKEEITNLKTNSTWYYCTSSYKSKDSQRPGKVDFDEYHAYQNYRMISVATTGLGKKALPRRTITTTNGNERGGPFDDLLEKCLSILSGDIKDNGTFPFICRLDKDEEVHDKTEGEADGVDNMKKLLNSALTQAALVHGLSPALLTGEVAGIKEALDWTLTVGIDPPANATSEELSNKLWGRDEIYKGNFIVADTSNIKHVDIFDIAGAADKLISSGFSNVDEARSAAGLQRTGEDWAQKHYLTKNYQPIDKLEELSETGGKS